MGSGFSKMKKQAKLMQDQYAKMKEEMANKRVTGVSGNGLVKITLDGERNMQDISIQRDCVDPEDIEGLEDLIKAAYDDASSQLDEGGDGDLSSMMGGLPFSL